MISDSPCVPDPASWFDGGKITFYYPAGREAKSRKRWAKVVDQFLLGRANLGRVSMIFVSLRPLNSYLPLAFKSVERHIDGTRVRQSMTLHKVGHREGERLPLKQLTDGFYCTLVLIQHTQFSRHLLRDARLNLATLSASWLATLNCWADEGV
jgi:hypothetical protein